MSIGGPRSTNITNWGPSMTKQSMQAETDINVIMARYEKTGMLSHVADNSPQYMDVSEVTDYRQALEQVRITEDFFKNLPGSMRAHFGHDAAAFLDFITDPTKEAEARALGLIPPTEREVPEVPAVGGGTVTPVTRARNPDGTYEKASEVRARQRAQAQERDEQGRFEREDED